MKYLYIFIFVLFPFSGYGQHASLTAEQILDSSIAFCGGEKLISGEQTSELTYRLIQPDGSEAVIDQKRIEGEKYVECILSLQHFPQTTFFDGIKISRVNADSVRHFKDLKTLEEVKLKTFQNIQVGYRKLKYVLKRQEDKKFQNFDCYVITAAEKNGYETMNFFDKANFRLIMVIYPNGNKSVMTEYEFNNGILINSHIINTFSNGEKNQTYKLIKAKLNNSLSEMWFNCPYDKRVTIPENIKLGTFKSTNGPITKFNRSAVSQDYFDDLDKLDLRRFLKWVFDDTFGLISEDDIKNKNESPESLILVRIISWSENGYVCQWIAGKYTDTQDYRIIE